MTLTATNFRFVKECLSRLPDEKKIGEMKALLEKAIERIEELEGRVEALDMDNDTNT